MCISIVNETFLKTYIKIKNATLSFDYSHVNLRSDKNLLRFSILFHASKKKNTDTLFQPCKWLKLLCFQKICLSFININTGVWRSELGTNSITRNLLLIFVVKSKKIVFQTKFCNQIISRNLSGG